MLYFTKRWGRVPQGVVRIVRNEAFIYKAENLRPRLITMETELNCDEKILKRGDEVAFDFGNRKGKIYMKKFKKEESKLP